MIRTLMAATAVSGLLLSTALAETPANPNQSGAMNSAKERSAVSTQAITQQVPSQWLGSQLIGLEVVGAKNEQIGDVNDILVDKSGKVDALVVGVGGFLGIGEKDVALPMTAFEVVPASNSSNKSSSDQLRLSMSKDQLQKHAEFKKLNNARATTGAGSAGEPASKPASGANPNANRGGNTPR
jgi:sporulation protein YlmC with PRC-barrel domain